MSAGPWRTECAAMETVKLTAVSSAPSIHKSLRQRWVYAVNLYNLSHNRNRLTTNMSDLLQSDRNLLGPACHMQPTMRIACRCTALLLQCRAICCCHAHCPRGRQTDGQTDRQNRKMSRKIGTMNSDSEWNFVILCCSFSLFISFSVWFVCQLAVNFPATELQCLGRCLNSR